LSTTFSVALWTTVLCVGLGYRWPIAVGKPPRQQRIAALFILLPFWTSALIKNFSCWCCSKERHRRQDDGIGRPFGGDQLLFNRATVVFAMTHTLLPLAVVTMLPVMNQIDRRLPYGCIDAGRQQRPGLSGNVLPAFDARRRRSRLLVLVARSASYHAGPGRGRATPYRAVDHPADQRAAELAGRQRARHHPADLAIATCIAYDRIFGLSSLSGGGTRQVRPMAVFGAQVLRRRGSPAWCSAPSRSVGAHIRGLRAASSSRSSRGQ